MKIGMQFRFSLLLLFILFSSNALLKAQSDNIGSFKDSRDGESYQTISIGAATWMMEDLRYDAEGSNLNDNGRRVYSWKTAKKVCPKGWKLPKQKELNQLFIDLHTGKLGKEAMPYFQLKEGKQYYWTATGSSNSISVFQLSTEGIQMYIDFLSSRNSCRCVKN